MVESVNDTAPEGRGEEDARRSRMALDDVSGQRSRFGAYPVDVSSLDEILRHFIPEHAQESPFHLEPAPGPCLEILGEHVSARGEGFCLDAGALEPGARIGLRFTVANCGLDAVTLAVAADPGGATLLCAPASLCLAAGQQCDLVVYVTAPSQAGCAVSGTVRLTLQRATATFVVPLTIEGRSEAARVVRQSPPEPEPSEKTSPEPGVEVLPAPEAEKKPPKSAAPAAPGRKRWSNRRAPEKTPQPAPDVAAAPPKEPPPQARPGLGRICPQCGKVNPDDQPLCLLCQTPLEGAQEAWPKNTRWCPKCHALYAFDYIYCPEDGEKLVPLSLP